jgi:NAD(P)H-nitrite reductase large subunit
MKENPIIICRCEDVTLEDIEEAFKNGFKDIESMRRHLKIGTGPCQGKTCIPILQKILAGLQGKKQIDATSTRPPESPVPLGALVRGKKK